MSRLRKGPNKVELSLPSSFTPILEFSRPYTGVIKLCKHHTDGETVKATDIKADRDDILDLSAYREYFTAYHEYFDKLIVTITARAILEYKAFDNALVESTTGKTIEFTVKENPNYKPPAPDSPECPICKESVPLNDLTSHIQATHM